MLNTRSDLNVTVIDSQGEKRQFVVPASTLMLSGSTVVPGLSFGMGRLDQQGSSESPMIATIADGWMLNPYTTFNAGLLGSTPYRAGGLGIDSQLFTTTSLSTQLIAAQNNKHGSNGVSGNVLLTHKLTERIGLSLSLTQQTAGYSELSDALQNDPPDQGGRSRNQIGGGISWSEDMLGNMSVSWSRGTTFDGDSNRYLRAGWSKSFGRAYLGASMEFDTGNQGSDGGNRFYLTLSIPIGDNRSVNSYMNNSGNGSRAGVRYSERTTRDRGWSLSSERDFHSQRTSGTGSMDITTSVSQLSGSLSGDSNSYTSWSARASGGVVAHDHGVTFTPNSIGDTFGIARVGEEAGVRMDTPGGQTWTDSRGYAVLPSLAGFKHSMIQLDTRTLGKNVDIANALQETDAGRGSVSYIDFDVVRARRILVTVTDTGNRPLLHGDSVFDARGNFVTVVGDKGSVFLPDGDAQGPFEVQESGSTLCSFTLELPEQRDLTQLYEVSDAVCR